MPLPKQLALVDIWLLGLFPLLNENPLILCKHVSYNDGDVTNILLVFTVIGMLLVSPYNPSMTKMLM